MSRRFGGMSVKLLYAIPLAIIMRLLRHHNIKHNDTRQNDTLSSVVKMSLINAEFRAFFIVMLKGVVTNSVMLSVVM